MHPRRPLSGSVFDLGAATSPSPQKVETMKIPTNENLLKCLAGLVELSEFNMIA